MTDDKTIEYLRDAIEGLRGARAAATTTRESIKVPWLRIPCDAMIAAIDEQLSRTIALLDGAINGQP